MAKVSGTTRSGSASNPRGLSSQLASATRINKEINDVLLDDGVRAFDMTQRQIDSEIGYRNIEGVQYNENGTLAFSISNLQFPEMEIKPNSNDSFTGLPEGQAKGIQKMIDIVKRNGREVKKLLLYRD